MLSQKGRTSDKKPSCLPVHSSREAKSDLTLSSWKAEHRLVDAKLLRLEEELDARIIREERTELTQNRLQYPDSSSSEATIENSHKLIDDYLALAHKSKGLEEMIKALKEECATTRSESHYLMTKIRSLSPRTKRFNIFGRKSLHSEDSLPYGGAESGFTDPLAVAERILSAENTATSVGGVVGAFGAGISYTTLFSATRGRLDLISWAFTCFILVVLSCAAYQMFSLPRHGQITRILRMEYLGSAEHRLLSYVILVGLPMIGGFLLLALSVAFLDTDTQTTIPGSQPAIRAAGYVPIVFLGYFVIAMIGIALITTAIRVLSWRNVLRWPMEHLPPQARKDYPSVLFTVKDKLWFLPGGNGYSVYRKQRLNRLKEEES